MLQRATNTIYLRIYLSRNLYTDFNIYIIDVIECVYTGTLTRCKTRVRLLTRFIQSEAIPREIEVLPEFIIGAHNLNNIRDVDDAVACRHTKETAGLTTKGIIGKREETKE